MKLSVLLSLFIGLILWLQPLSAQHNGNYGLPILKTGNDTVNSVFHIAIGNIVTNIRIRNTIESGEIRPLLYAGLDYGGAWTRDAAINVWNGIGLLFPEVSKNTLLEVLTKIDGKTIIGGQYWDKIIWSVGAWNYYLYTGDKNFLPGAYEAVKNTIEIMEKDEFDPKINLFRGGSLIGDGIGAYDDKYTDINGYEGNLYAVGSIEKWARSKDNAGKRNPSGGGLPMMCLSTNCIYYETYRILARMERTLGKEVNPAWEKKAAKLKEAIEREFWIPEKGIYRYYIDPWSKCDYQEGAGISLAILFGIADNDQREKIFKNAFVSPAGMPSVWPSFPRYYDEKKQTYGRFTGVVWPPIQGFWAEAAIRNKKTEQFVHDFRQLTLNAYRDKQFREIYHPITGLPYGGMMENIHVRPLGTSTHEFGSTNVQAWSASAYINMILKGLIGMDFSESGIDFHPNLPNEFRNFILLNVPYRNTVLNFRINGKGNVIESFTVNGEVSKPFISAQDKGVKNIAIVLKK